MPKDRLQGLAGMSESSELPGMPVNKDVLQDGVSSGSTSGQSSERAAAENFTRQALLDMQAERDLAPSLAEEEGDEEEEGFIPLRKLGTGYITICPYTTYEWLVVVTRDVRLSKGKEDPYLVVVDCNQNASGLQSAHFQDHIICIYPPSQDRITCD